MALGVDVGYTKTFVFRKYYFTSISLRPGRIVTAPANHLRIVMYRKARFKAGLGGQLLRLRWAIVRISIMADLWFNVLG